jgi:hypothetical protein
MHAELTHQRRKSILVDPLPKIRIWSASLKNLPIMREIGIFQHNTPLVPHMPRQAAPRHECRRRAETCR